MTEKKSATKAARRELFMMTDPEFNPDWDKDPSNIKRRNELLLILYRIDNEPVAENCWQRYFDKRPGLEDKVLGLLRNGATGPEIFEEVGVNIQRPVAYLRSKYGIPVTNKRKAKNKA